MGVQLPQDRLCGKHFDLLINFPHKEQEKDKLTFTDVYYLPGTVVSTCFTDDTSFNPPSQIMIPFLRKENQGEKKKKRKPRCRERNEIVQGQPIQEAGASREPLSIPLAPGPPCLAPWHLGIVWLLSQLHRDAKSGGRCPSKGVCLVSLGG